MKLLPVLKAAIETHLQFRHSPEKQRRLAEKRLIRSVRHAYKHVPFYQQAFDKAGLNIDEFNGFDDLKKLPFLYKDDVQRHFPEGLIARGTDMDDVMHSATTGSSGKATNFVFHPKTYAYYLSCAMRELTMIGYRPWHRAVYIKYNPVPMPTLGPLFRVAHIPSLLPVEEHIRRLRKEKPDLLVGYASLIHDIALHVTDDDLKHIQPKFISLNSEMTTPEQREFITRRLGAPCYDEYSTEETWMIAAQCKEYNYHLFTDNVWVEFLDENGNEVGPGEVGEIVLTTLQAHTMPFIRYRIGDLGRPGKGDCPCGMGFPLLEAFEGRADDAFILSDGRQVPALKLLNTFTTFIKSDPGLMDEFKLIQTDIGRVTIRLAPGPSYQKDRIDAMTEKLQSLIDDPVTFSVELVEHVDEPGAVKHRAIESWVRREDVMNAREQAETTHG